MRQFGLAVLFVLTMCGHAFGAVDTGLNAGRERGESDDYVVRFRNAYTALRNAHPQPTADQPPLDLIALPHAFDAAEPVFKACTTARAPTDLGVSASRCYMAALKGVTIAAGQRDMDLFEAFSATALQMVADVDAGRLPRAQYSAAYRTLTDAYDLTVRMQYAEFLAAQGKSAQGEAPPFDHAGLAAAEAELKQIGCDAAASGAALAKCLLGRTTTFNNAVRVSDTTSFDIVIATTKRGGEAVDAGRMTREELRRGYELLEATWRMALRLRRERWAGDLYVARMDSRYDAARQAQPGIASLDLSAAAQAVAARSEAQAACDAAQYEARPNAWLECYLAADKAFVAALRMSDHALYDALEGAARQAAAETEAGKLTPQDLSSAYNAMARNFNARLERQGADFEASQFSAAHITQFDKDYAAHKPTAPANAAGAGAPPYDPAMASTASLGLAADWGVCREKSFSDAKTDVCYRAGIERFATVLKIQDRALLEAYFLALQRILADAQTGKVSAAAALALLDTIDKHFSEILDAQQFAYLGIVGKPVADEYATRYARTYEQAPHPLGVEAPYETSASSAARAADEKANSACLARDQADINALTDCFIEARKAWTATMKIRDAALQDAYVATLRAIAADITAGKFDKRQWIFVVNAVIDAYSNRLNTQGAEWERRQINLVVAEHIGRFSRVYRATFKPIADDIPPYDAALLEKASVQINARIREQCSNRRAELKNEAGYAGCYNGLIGELAVAMQLRDTALLKAYQDGLMAAAVANDAGQLTAAQVGAIYRALYQAYGDGYRKQLADWRARINRPLGDRYVTQFDKAYAGLRAGKPALAAGPVLVLDAAAATLHENAKDDCVKRRAAMKTETVYRACLLAANRAYAIATKFNDMDLFEAFIATARAAAADADAGQLTREQSDYVQSRLGSAFDGIRNKRNLDWQNRADQPLIESYRTLFEKDYAAAARPLDDALPPYDIAARLQASEEASASAARCRADRAKFSSRVAYFQCFADLQRSFATAIKLQDKVLIGTLVNAVLAAAADGDAGRITVEQSNLIYTALVNAFAPIYQRQSDVWQTKAAKPIVGERVTRFQALYRDARAAAGPLPADVAPLDFAAGHTADAARVKAFADCDARAGELKTQAARDECRIAANRAYLAAIKTRDMALFEVWAALVREAAADLDSGKLSSAQWRAVTVAMNQLYNGARHDAIVQYYLRQPAVTARVHGFDNDYTAARKARGALTTAAPVDEAAVSLAMAAHDRATAACDDRRAEMKTSAPWVACLITAQRDFTATIKLQDTLLIETYVAALRAAADDADAGKLSRDQLDAIRTGIGYAFGAILMDQVQTWKSRATTK